MNLYINPDNQKLLWNIINNNPFITHFFNILPPTEKQLWFKHIIEKIYFENQQKIITYESLKELNKATLTFMLQDIKNKQNPSVQPIQREHPNQINTPPIVKENKSDVFQHQYDERQQIYQDMVKKEVPDEIDFSTKVEDGAIKNMDELIKQHQNERELDIQKFQPQPLTMEKPPKLNIDKSSDINIEKETETIQSDVKQEPKMKQVTWGNINIYFDNDESKENFTMYQEDISIIHNQYHELHQEVTNLKEEIVMIKEQLSKILKNSD